VEIVVAQAVGRQLIDVGRVDQTAKAADLGEADVVEQKDDDVRRVLVWAHGLRPPLFALVVGLGDLALELLNRFRARAPDRDREQERRGQGGNSRNDEGLPEGYFLHLF
jgi:hypothetical protein